MRARIIDGKAYFPMRGKAEELKVGDLFSLPQRSDIMEVVEIRNQPRLYVVGKNTVNQLLTAVYIKSPIVRWWTAA